MLQESLMQNASKCCWQNGRYLDLSLFSKGAGNVSERLQPSLFKKILKFLHLVIAKLIFLHSFTLFLQRRLPENPFLGAAEEELTICAAAQ